MTDKRDSSYLIVNIDFQVLYRRKIRKYVQAEIHIIRRWCYSRSRQKLKILLKVQFLLEVTRSSK